MTMSEAIIRLESKKSKKPPTVAENDIDWERLRGNEFIRDVLVRYAPKKPTPQDCNFGRIRRRVDVSHPKKNFMSKRYESAENHYEELITAAINMISASVTSLYWTCQQASKDGFEVSYDTEINGHWNRISVCESALVATLSSIASGNDCIDLGFGTTYGFWLCLYHMIDSMFKSQLASDDERWYCYRWLKSNPMDEIDEVIRNSDLSGGGEDWFKIRSLCAALRAGGMYHEADMLEQYESFDEMREERRKKFREAVNRVNRIFNATEGSDEK